MSGRKIWINFEAPQQYIRHINHWKKMQQFDVIFKIFGRAIFEAIEVKGPQMLNFEVTTSKFCNHF